MPNSAFDRIAPTPELIAAAGTADVLYYCTLAQREELTRSTLHILWENSGDALQVCDINFRKDCYDEAIITSSVRNADLVKLNEDEVGTLLQLLGKKPMSYQDCAELLLTEFGNECVIISRGAEGAYARTAAWESKSPGFRVDVVDTVGSGDNFMAAFLDRYLRGEDLRSCLDFGNYWGALAAMKAGGFSRISDEDKALLASQSASRLY